MVDSDVINIYKKCKSKRLSSFINNCDEDVFNYIKYRFNDSLSMKESLHRILNNIYNRPVCPVCGKKVEYVGRHNLIYRKYCSNECKYVATNMVERHKNGCIKKYGVDNISKLDEIKAKKKNTFISHYGCENNLCRKEVRDKIYNIYGVDNVSKLEYIKQKKIDTTRKHYNEDYALRLEHVREARKSKESLLKEYETKKQNGSYGKSLLEDISYLYIKEHYGDVIRQYESNEYPFACDFYIQSLDLYIECNYHWTHGRHPYNPNNENDNIIIEQWKSKNTKFYDNAIDIWTKRDVEKRSYKDKINWIEFFNIDELKEWIEKQ